MKRNSFFSFKVEGFGLFCVKMAFVFMASVYSLPSEATIPKSYLIPNPIGWMHMLPVGELPGWGSKFWVQFDVSHANIWNAPVDLLNTENGLSYRYFADFAQTHALLEVGMAPTDFWSVSLEAPYTYWGGGFLDAAIDGFHVIIGSDRFARPRYDRHKVNFDVETEGVDYFPGTTNNYQGVGNIKLKTKLWWWKWMGKQKGSCDCGFSTSFQVKFPTESSSKAMTSGHIDYSGLWHLGVPLFDSSAMWLTSSVTYLGENDAFADWPRIRWHQMYEMSFDLAVDRSWGIIFQLRTESPFMEKKKLTIVDTSGDSEKELLQRVSSGWNSLVNWRSSESFGFRYRTTTNSQWNFLFIEDWGIGQFDKRGDNLYVNNAPDVVFAIQYAKGI